MGTLREFSSEDRDDFSISIGPEERITPTRALHRRRDGTWIVLTMEQQRRLLALSLRRSFVLGAKHFKRWKAMCPLRRWIKVLGESRYASAAYQMLRLRYSVRGRGSLDGPGHRGIG